MSVLSVSPRPTAHARARLRLLLEAGLLVALLAGAVAITPIGKAWIQQVVESQQADRQLSYLATEIVIQTLQCRRFEKDIFLHVGTPAVRDTYVARWSQATSDLDRAIERFGAAAIAAADRARAETWRAESVAYRAAMLETIREIDAGVLTTPEAANAELAPTKDSIRGVMAVAEQVAREKGDAARLRSEALSGAITSSARLVILASVVGLVLSAGRLR